MKRLFPTAPAQLPGEMPKLLRRLADLWAQHPARPRPSPNVLEHWDSLVAQCSDDPSLPLLVRKPANNRGAVLVNGAGRKIIPTDNSPAQWAFALAVLGDTPSLAWVHEQLSCANEPWVQADRALRSTALPHRTVADCGAFVGENRHASWFARRRIAARDDRRGRRYTRTR